MSRLNELRQADALTRARAIAALGAAPHTLTEQERRQALELVQELATLRSAPPSTLAPSVLDAISGPLEGGLTNIVLPPLPRELKTRARLMHDEMHTMILHSNPQLMYFSLMIDELLRKNQEYAQPFELITAQQRLAAPDRQAQTAHAGCLHCHHRGTGGPTAQPTHS